MKERLIMWACMLAATLVPWLWVEQAAISAPAQSPITPASAAPAVQQLSGVRRICIEDFEGGENSKQLRAMLIDQLRRLGSFVITENPDNADAFLRGFAEDLVFTEQHSRDEAVSTRGSASLATGGYTRNRSAVAGSVGGNESVRDRSTQRRHEASLAVRIVNRDGDVLWSSTAESRGGKFRSAAADVTARIMEELDQHLHPKQREPSGN